MSTKKKMFLSAAGAGGGGPTDVDDVFSTFLYTGNGGTQSIVNNIDLTEGGLVWAKRRDSTSNGSHTLMDTERGTGSGGRLRSDNNQQAYSPSDAVTAFNNNGFSLGADASINGNNYEMVSWTFRKAPKFFDIVTYTGNGVAGRTISHNLDGLVGMLMIKCISHSSDWSVQHRMVLPSKYLALNETTGQQTDTARFHSTAAGNSTFSVGSGNAVNGSGRTYVAYLFAHNNSGNPGEFGPDGDQDIIKCGSYTGNSTDARTIDLGFEASWLLVKRQDGATDWWIVDDMRGLFARQQTGRYLEANTSNSDANQAKFWADSQGFAVDAGDYNTGGETYIYMAIRRGSLNTPENATDVFDVDQYTGGQAVNTKFNSAGFPADMLIHLHKIDNVDNNLATKLLDKLLVPNSTAAAVNTDYASWENNNGWVTGESTAGNTWRLASGANNHIVYAWKRAPSYFDVVSYIGTGSNRTVTHNLGVAPEMMWVKSRDRSEDWNVYHSATGNQAYIKLNSTDAATTSNTNTWNSTTPTASVFTLGTRDGVNKNNDTFIAYLFATVAGVSKVGSVSHSYNSTTNVDCGFSSGARFVLAKSTASGAWYVWDSVRGIVSGNDPYLLLNSSANEVTNGDLIDPYSGGFAFSPGFYTDTYIFYAIA